MYASTRTHVQIVTYPAPPTTLIAGHEHSVEEWNVWYDLQPKCQCCAVVRGRQRSEIESQCVRKSLRKCCLCVREKERKVRKETTERQRERERDRRRVCSCTIVTNSRLLFILACGSQQPPHIRCEIGGREEG